MTLGLEGAVGLQSTSDCRKKEGRGEEGRPRMGLGARSWLGEEL